MDMHQKLKVYEKAFNLALRVFELSKRFPKEEHYALTDQMRKSTRLVCSNIAEGYKKRLHPTDFIEKLNDADVENTETQVWIDFALACKYITKETQEALYNDSQEVSKLLEGTIKDLEKFCIR